MVELKAADTGLRFLGCKVLLEIDAQHPEDLVKFKRWLAELIARCSTAELHPDVINGLLGRNLKPKSKA